MKKNAIAVAVVLSVFGLPMSVSAQEKAGAVAVEDVEAVVTVIDIDRDARTVTIQGPRGRTATINVPEEAQNLDQVQPGSRFKVRYLESVAVALSRGDSPPSAASAQQVKLAPKGDTPGGQIVRVTQISGAVEAIDLQARTIAVRGPEGRTVEVRVSEEVSGLDLVEAGDTVTLQVTEALAMRMIKQ